MKTIGDANAHIFHLETKTSSSQSNETIADVNASYFILNQILVKSVKWNTKSCKCTCDSYKVKSSSNQSKETFGNANALLFHEFLSCLVIRQHSCFTLPKSSLLATSLQKLLKICQGLWISTQNIITPQQSAIHIKSNLPQINQKKHLEMQIHFYFISFSLVS